VIFVSIQGDSEFDPLSLEAIADADPYPYWYEDADEPFANPTLVRTETCDLCIVGGGYTGLWTAIIAKERDPSRDVVLIDAHEVGSAASGRNGGFMEASLTHGVANGQARFGDELPLLEELGIQNLDEIEKAIERYNIDCDYERTGVIDVASDLHPAGYTDELREDYLQLRQLGQKVTWLDAEQMRAQVNSPTYTGGLWRHDLAAIVDPARLVWGLKAAAEFLGVRIYEDTKATSIERDGVGVLVETPLGRVRAGKVALATNADIPNQFHYYRLTEDNRILWGGYDAIYYFRGKMNSELESRPESWARLSTHFFRTFPQLDDVKFSHMWGGAIDTCSRFCVFWGQAMNGRVGYAVGYTGLGVASSRFGAEVMLDLIDGRRSRATETRFVKEKPLPFPPEPFKFMGVQATRWSLDREDKTGKRNMWLKTMDRLGLGFDT